MKNLNTNKSPWKIDLLTLAGNKKPSQSLLKLYEAGIKTIQDLVWIFPLRIQKAPTLSTFDQIKINELFLGQGIIISINSSPAYGKRGKKNIQLFNISCVIKDQQSDHYLTLKWFNAYPSIKKQLEQKKELTFMGKVSDFKGTLQIVNPNLNVTITKSNNDVLIEYPTVNSVSGKHIQSIINRIDLSTWIFPMSILTQEVEDELGLMRLNKAFQFLHGKTPCSTDEIKYSKTRIIYEEFLQNQFMFLARKFKNKKLKAPIITITDEELNHFLNIFPYELTKDQKDSLTSIRNDLEKNRPMMRMLQGDVGCGKTSVAIIAALMAIKNHFQVAFMCPTEALASQHVETISKILPQTKHALLLGSTKSKEKKSILEKLASGEIELIIGTHSLIQNSVQFKNLGLVIIDEQHKFGVEQRQKLSLKSDQVHTLTMSATPIPRSLQMAQYGDLDISTIEVLPGGRKGIKSRIVTPQTYEKYLSFIKTRMSLGEQVYIVVPAIEESEAVNLNNINSILESYKKYFPEYNISCLHGQMSSQEKQEIMDLFTQGKIDLLVATTVIEVGINVLNSTVISIYNPERFGLSSLHQLRGRVGRGNKPGFCFLVTDQNISTESMNRIKIIEKTNDGFEIAQADLKNRGQGDLFGPDQSGHISSFRIANIVEHYDTFNWALKDLEKLKIKHTEMINQTVLNFIDKTEVSSTI